ncbi:MAG: DsbA family protein [Herpetosiphonaceae bacterium]|nr:DsbA family protein [Herpetosiphonaceae bacterium]
MTNRSKPTQGKPRSRGRTVPKKSRLPLYLGIGMIGIIGLIVVLVNTLNPTAETAVNLPPREPLTAAVGQTAEGYWYKGDPNAPVKIVEYADFECPACAKLEQELLQTNFDQLYVETGKVQFIYRELPLTSIHSSAQLTAEVARCAGDQNLFWPVHDALFDTQKQWERKPNAREIILTAAAKAGASRTQLDSCLAAGTHTAAVNASTNEAMTRGVQSTPTVYVNDQEVKFVSDFASTLIKLVDGIVASQSSATP